jgi:hypothetical protein
MKNWMNKVFKPVATYGAILAGVVILHSVLMDAFDLTFSKYNEFAAIGLPIIGIVLSIYAYRKEHSGNQISYGKALGVGVMVAFIFGILGSGYSVINYTYINPDFREVTMVKLEDRLIEKGMDDDVIEMLVERQRKIMKPARTMISGVLGLTFIGLVVSLIAAAFIKKESENPFTEADIE